MNVLADIGLWLWRLLPANPILVRVVSMGGKRTRHLWARLLYLGLLFIVVIFSQNLMGTKSLAELAKSATQVFMYVSLVQLFLMSFIAPVFCAGAITQEKDANTYHILLTTPLSNAQIVLGSLFSRIYFIWVLLIAGLPIFGITMIYGGVTTTEVFLSFGLAACTGLITGALAIAISFLKVGTRRTIFAFFVGIALYMLGVWAIGVSNWGQLPEAPTGTSYFGTARQLKMSWLAPIHPFLALAAVTGQTPPPDPAELGRFGWPWRWMLANPSGGYILLTTLGSLVLVLLSLFVVRRSLKEGESTLTAWLNALLRRSPVEEVRRKPRRVWNNPIAWRESETRASAGGRSWLRWVLSFAGLIAGLVLLIGFESHWWGLTAANPTRIDSIQDWLIKLIWVQFAVVLLVVTNTAASSLTREKESQTLEMLLTTPLTSADIALGTVKGLMWFVLPLLAAPMITLTLFVIADLLRAGPAVVHPEAVLLAPGVMFAVAATTAMIGLQFSLTSRKTVQAVMVSAGSVLIGITILWGCGVAFISASPAIASVLVPFSPVPALSTAIDIGTLFGPGATPTAAEQLRFRVTRAVAMVASIAAYLAIAYTMYRGLVRSFDMTVRRQSV